MQYSEEIIASKVCIIMGDAGDDPKREQIVIILRFFSFNFFFNRTSLQSGNVKNTSILVIHVPSEMCYKLLFFNDYPYTNYVHYMAH